MYINLNLITMDSIKIKEIVKEKYSEIANQSKEQNESSDGELIERAATENRNCKGFLNFAYADTS